MAVDLTTWQRATLPCEEVAGWSIDAQTASKVDLAQGPLLRSNEDPSCLWHCCQDSRLLKTTQDSFFVAKMVCTRFQARD